MTAALSEILTHILTVWLSLAPLLLVGAVIAGLLHVLLPPHFIRRALRGRGGVARAVLIGVPLPLCSCGVIPAGLGLRRDGASRGATVGFLISTPQTGIDSILVSGSMLGAPFALYKVAAAALTGLIGGGVTELTTRDEMRDEARDKTQGKTEEMTIKGEVSEGVSLPRDERAPFSALAWLREVFNHAESILSSIWGWLLFGVITSALITYALPSLGVTELLSVSSHSRHVETSSLLSGGSLALSYALTLMLSIPLYICATASVPIAAALVAQGLPIGVALVFLMAGPATNLATIGAVYRGLGRRSLIIYLATIIGGSLVFALFLDLGLGWEAPLHLIHSHEHSYAWWELALSALLGVWLLMHIAEWITLVTKRWGRVVFMSRARRDVQESQDQHHHLKVSGITCQGCVRKLTRALMGRGDVSTCEVNEVLDTVHVTGELTRGELEDALRQVGFPPFKSPELSYNSGAAPSSSDLA